MTKANKSTTVLVRMTADERDRLRVVAKARNTTVSAVLRAAAHEQWQKLNLTSDLTGA